MTLAQSQPLLLISLAPGYKTHHCRQRSPCQLLKPHLSQRVRACSVKYVKVEKYEHVQDYKSI